MADLMHELGTCEEVSQLLEKMDRTIDRASRDKLPATYCLGMLRQYSFALKTIIAKRSGGIYFPDFKNPTHENQTDNSSSR